MKTDLLTIGDVDIDLYMKIDEKEVVSSTEGGGEAKICFYHGSKIPVSHFDTSVAGNSLNVGVACSLLGLKTELYTETGDDDNANKVLSELKGFGVGTAYCIRNKGTPTNVHTVIIYGGDRTIFSYHEKRTYKVRDWEEPGWLYYTSLGYGFEGFQEELISYLKEHSKVGVAFNPGTIQMKMGLEKLKNFIEITDILFLNTEEAKRLVGDFPLKELHKKIHLLGAKLSVITDAQNGASASDGDSVIEINAYSDSRPVVDKTGAGDAFSSGFLSAIFYGKNLKEALAWGVINAGNQIKEIGSLKGLCDKKQIEEIAKKIS
jgi:sugar/nucleoside kinase (ribokinase family)